jgi:Zinc finger, C2H2 type
MLPTEHVFQNHQMASREQNDSQLGLSSTAFGSLGPPYNIGVTFDPFCNGHMLDTGHLMIKNDGTPIMVTEEAGTGFDPSFFQPAASSPCSLVGSLSHMGDISPCSPTEIQHPHFENLLEPPYTTLSPTFAVMEPTIMSDQHSSLHNTHHIMPPLINHTPCAISTRLKAPIEPAQPSKLGIQIRRDITYKCSSCNLSFTWAKDLKRHKQSVHASQGNWVCPMIGCKRGNKPFRRRDKMSSHIKTAHAEALKKFSEDTGPFRTGNAKETAVVKRSVESNFKELIDLCYRSHEWETKFASFQEVTDYNASQDRRGRENLQQSSPAACPTWEWNSSSDFEDITPSFSETASFDLENKAARNRDAQYLCPDIGCQARFSRQSDLTRHKKGHHFEAGGSKRGFDSFTGSDDTSSWVQPTYIDNRLHKRNSQFVWPIHDSSMEILSTVSLRELWKEPVNQLTPLLGGSSFHPPSLETDISNVLEYSSGCLLNRTNSLFDGER